MTLTQVEQENLALIARGWEAFNAGDMTTLAEMFASDAVWRESEAGILKAAYEGRDAIFQMFDLLTAETNGTLRSIPGTLAAAGEKVFGQAIVTAERKGRSLELDEVLIFTIKDGKIQEIRFYPFDHVANAQFWSE